MSLTIAQWLSDAEQQLIAAGVDDSADFDARLLLQGSLDCSASYLVAWPEKPLPEAVLEQLQHWLARRCDGEPIAYILGQQPFWTLDLKVSPATLIPRPDTEVLVEKVLALFDNNTPLTVLDLGTGTGAIALSIQTERPSWRVFMSDVSADALAVATQNAAAHRLPVRGFQGDWLQAVAPRSLNLILSNPPYIPEDDPHLASLVFEPLSALVAADAGLSDIERLLDGATRCLKPGGGLFIEHGYDQRQAVIGLFERYGFEAVCCEKDYGGNDRFTFGYWPE